MPPEAASGGIAALLAWGAILLVKELLKGRHEDQERNIGDAATINAMSVAQLEVRDREIARLTERNDQLVRERFEERQRHLDEITALRAEMASMTAKMADLQDRLARAEQRARHDRDKGGDV